MCAVCCKNISELGRPRIPRERRNIAWRADMRAELRLAYPKLKREWHEHGKVRRMEGVKGVPDFLLSVNARPSLVVFTEVKAIETDGCAVGLDMSQAIQLRDFTQCGFVARVLVLVLRSHGESKWAVCDGPFLDDKLNQINLHITQEWRRGALTPALLLGN